MSVLLLNATYEAIRVISLKRAIGLVLQEKAEIIESAGDFIRSTSIAVPRPQVIRLKYFVRIPYKSKVPLSNRAVLNRDRYMCVYCGRKATTVDHVVPKSKGGKHHWDNVVACCKPCNSEKSNYTLDQIGWELKVKPDVPHARTWIMVGTSDKVKAWANWLGYERG